MPTDGGPSLRTFYAQNERLAISGGTLLAVFVIWETIARSGFVNPLFISSPTLVALAEYHLFAEGEIWKEHDVYGLSMRWHVPPARPRRPTSKLHNPRRRKWASIFSLSSGLSLSFSIS